MVWMSLSWHSGSVFVLRRADVMGQLELWLGVVYHAQEVVGCRLAEPALSSNLEAEYLVE